MTANYILDIEGYALQSYLKAEEGVLYAHNNDYQYWYIDGSIYSDFAINWEKDRVNNLSIACKKIGMRPIFHGNFKSALSSDVEPIREASVAYTKKEVDICEKLQCPLIIHGGAIVEPRKIQLSKKIALSGLIQSIKELKEYADSKGVEIWLENLSNYPKYKPFHYIGTTLVEFLEIIKATDVDIFFDFGHANINASLPVEEFFSSIHHKVKGVSISNNNGIIDEHLGFMSGTINYKKVIEIMYMLNWRGIIGFEIRETSPKQFIIDFKKMINEFSLLSRNEEMGVI